MTDTATAREQWLAQVKVIRRNERRMVKVLSQAYLGGLARYIATGAVALPLEAQMGVSASLVRMWREAIETGARFAMDSDKGAYPTLQTKADELTLFEEIMREFVQRFGAMKVQQILNTTRDQLVRIIDKGVADGLGQEAIAKLINDTVPGIAKTRARVIARTETHTAAMHASQEVAKTSPFPMQKRWISVFDHRTRDFGEGDGIADQANHRVMNEVTVGPDELFAVPRQGGFDMMVGPGDPSAPGYQVINCFHPDTLILGAGLQGGIRRHYIGQLVKVSLGGPLNLTVTPNHPILTDTGWIAAGDIVKGDNLVYCGIGDNGELRPGFDVNNGYASAHQLYNSGDALCSVGGVFGVVMNFHGEMVTEQVNVVAFNGGLRDRFKALGDKLFGQLGFAHADVTTGDLLARRMVALGNLIASNDADSLMRGACSGNSAGLCGHGGLAAVSFRYAGSINAKLGEDRVYAGAGQVELRGDGVDGIPSVKRILNGGMVRSADGFPPRGHVAFEFRKCRSVETFHYDGPVYNFESDTGILVGNGIVNHNCRCALVYRRVGRPWPKSTDT